MSLWTDPQAWAMIRQPGGCPICQRGVPLNVVAELEASWVTMSEAAPMRGYACLVSRVHAVELYDLSHTEAAAFMRDIQRLARAVAESCQPIKVNYEIHGNTLPHLHLHLFPRYVGDPFEGRPIDPRATNGPAYAPSEFAQVRDQVVRHLAATSGADTGADTRR